MMLAINVQGREYVPLLAIPAITTNFFGVSDVARMICEPDSFCDADNDVVLNVFQVSSAGELLEVFPVGLGPFAKAGTQYNTPTDDVLKNCVVPSAELKYLFHMLLACPRVAERVNSSLPSWNDSPTLPAQTATTIKTYIRQPLMRGAGRSNSRLTKRFRLEEAYSELEKRCKDRGITLDKHNLPGYKRDLLRILIKIDTKIYMAISTFDGQAKLLGWKWRQGSKPRDAIPLLNIFGLELNS